MTIAAQIILSVGASVFLGFLGYGWFLYLKSEAAYNYHLSEDHKK